MFPLLFAFAAGWAAQHFIGARAWWVFGPLLLLLFLSPAAGAAAFLILAGLAIVGLACYLLIAFLPHIIGFFLGIAFVILLIIGLGELIGAP